MFILLWLVVGLGYLTLLEKKGVSLDPCDMTGSEFGLVLLLVPIKLLILSVYVYFTQGG